MKRVFWHLGSLKLTTALLACGMLIVFFGTLDQVDWGVGVVQKHYFESLFAAYPISAHSWAGWSLLGPLGRFFADIGLRIPMPGGFLIGGLLLVNLVAAHFRHFKPGLARIGIGITHAGVLLLVVSGFATAYFQKESMTSIMEGEAVDWSESFDKCELALTDLTDAAKDRVTVVPEALLRDTSTKGVFPVPGTPLTLRLHRYLANAPVIPPMQAAQFPALKPVEVDRGFAAGGKIKLFEQPETFSPNSRNTPAAVVEVLHSGKSLGTWLVSTSPNMGSFSLQTFTYEGRRYDISLRMARTYFRGSPGEIPFILRLNRFTHDIYPGTDIPKNFASDLTLADPHEASPRDVNISMNKPLRHAGFTFYQASFQPLGNGRFMSQLQTVQNPSYLLPYLSVFLVGFGMLIHFGITLVRFVGGKKTGAAK